MPPNSHQRHLLLFLLLAAAAISPGHVHAETSPSSCSFSDHHHDHDGHEHEHEHNCDDDHHHHHEHEHHHHNHDEIQHKKLPEEIAEEADLEMYGFGRDHHHHHHHQHEHEHEHNHEGEVDASPLGVWVSAMGCSLLVSLASLVSLIILPVILFKGKPSKAVVDSLAIFGAGAMLGDAFLHQLPHAFSGHSHSDPQDHQDHHHNHGHSHSHAHAHAHSLEDLSIGLSILFGIILFFIVEKIVRYVEDNSVKGTKNLGHEHHHHHHRQGNYTNDKDETSQESNDHKDKSKNEDTDGRKNGGSHTESKAILRKRSTSSGAEPIEPTDGELVNPANSLTTKLSPSADTLPASSLVFGYLNLFSDGVHNFTDGMALGSAFLLHGSVGGWSRTLFLLAHELPQEVGDFGILVRSGFSVSSALGFNFLSALVALAGTGLALVLGKDPGHSSLIEGFTAGGFIYIAVAGVLPQMNTGKTTLTSTLGQLMSLLLGMLVALGISLVE